MSDADSTVNGTNEVFDAQFTIAKKFADAIDSNETGANLTSEELQLLDDFLPEGNFDVEFGESFHGVDDLTGEETECVTATFKFGDMPVDESIPSNDVDLSDYSMPGTDGTVRKVVGPSGAKMGDNPMSKTMAVTEASPSSSVSLLPSGAKQVKISDGEHVYTILAADLQYYLDRFPYFTARDVTVPESPKLADIEFSSDLGKLAIDALRYENSPNIDDAEEENNACDGEESELKENNRLIGKAEDGSKLAKVYYNSEWDEYSVKFYQDGMYDPEQDYFASDKEDALITAKTWVHEVVSENKPAASYTDMLESYIRFKNSK